MGTLRIPDKLLNGPQAARLTDAQFRRWVLALSWIAEWETDGVYVSGRRERPVGLVAKGIFTPTGEPQAYEVFGWDECSANTTRRTISPETKRKVRERDGTDCRYCGEPTLPGHQVGPLHPRYRTYDHVIPVSNGGTNDVDNLVVACRRCNSKKGTRHVDDFLSEGMG